MQKKHQKRFDRFYQLAEVCYAYHYVLQSVREPFTDAQPSVLYNMACFLVLKVVPKETQGKPLLEPPNGMSTVTILQVMSKPRPTFSHPPTLTVSLPPFGQELGCESISL